MLRNRNWSARGSGNQAVAIRISGDLRGGRWLKIICFWTSAQTENSRAESAVYGRTFRGVFGQVIKGSLRRSRANPKLLRNVAP